MTTFPFGYKRPPGGGEQGMGTMLTWSQMMTMTTVSRLHPEVRRRFKALIEYAATKGVPLGCGTGWRVQPNPPPPGFAKPGNSWHESCPVNPVSNTALAVDTVPQSSWDWMERNSRPYGLRTFRYVNNEPWHIQPTEIPASRKGATRLPPINIWNLPGTPAPRPPAPGPTPSPTKGGDVWFIAQFHEGSTYLVSPDQRVKYPISGIDYFWPLLDKVYPVINDRAFDARLQQIPEQPWS